MILPFVSIDYGEAGYRAVTVRIRDGEEPRRFESGDPVEDWKRALLFCVDEGAPGTLFSSDVDHFVMDVDGYKFIEVEGVDVLVKDEGGR